MGMAKRNVKRERGEGRGTLRGLPPLVAAYRIQEDAARVGFDWPDAKGPFNKVEEELSELKRATDSGQREAIEDELGDLLFAVVNLARKLGVDPEAVLARANDKFTRRFEGVERLARERGLELGRASLEELDRLWEEIKRR